MTLTMAQVMGWMAGFLWPFFRIGAFLYALPLIGARSVPQRTRLILAGAITVIIAPLLPPMPEVALFSIQSVLITAQQVLIGVALGFVVQLIFQAFTTAGQFIAMQNGLGFSSMVDPMSGVTVTSISQLYLITINLMFVALQGHLALVRLIVDSFTLLPVSTEGITADGYQLLANSGGWLLARGTLLALPAVVALLVVNIAFGVMGKMAPQLNIMSVGFPMNMVLGALIIWLSMAMVAPELEKAMTYCFELLKQVARPHV